MKIRKTMKKSDYKSKINNAKLAIILFCGLICNITTLAQNPLSLADNFNIITEGNLTITAGDIEGAIAVGGNFSVLGNSQRTSANATGGQGYVTIGGVKYALIVGGGLSGVNGGNIFKIDGKAGATDDHFIRFNSLSGSTAVTNSGGIDIGSPVTNNLNRYIRVNATSQTAASVQNTASLYSFTTNFSSFKANSLSMSTCTGNVTATVSGGQANINLGANTNNVWNVTGATLNTYSQINLSGNLPSASRPLIINVNNAGTFNWANVKFIMGSESDNFMEINRAPYIIWNFYNASALNIQNSNLVLGSILAPLADMKNNASGNITGQVIAKTFTKPNAGELHIAKFNANVICGASNTNCVACTGTNLLSNPSFETNNLTNWNSSNASNSTGTGYASCGNYNAFLYVTPNTGTGYLYQQINYSTVGANLTLTIDGGVHNSSYNAVFALEFWKANNTKISQVNSQQIDFIVDNAPANTLQKYTITGVVPAETAFIRVVAQSNGDYVKVDNACLTAITCNATLSGFKFTDLNGATPTNISNNGKYSIANLPAAFKIDANTTGTVGSVKFTVSGSTTSTIIENTAPYNFPATGNAFNFGPGVYTIVAEVFSGSNASGAICDTETITFTLYQPASLGNYVWLDLNKNGIQDNRIDPNNGSPIDLGAELPVANVKIELYKADGTFVAFQNTNSEGKYLFENLMPANYFIKLDPASLPSSEYVITNINQGANNELDSDIAKITYRSVNTELVSGENDLSWDLGIYKSSTPEISDPCGCEEKFIYTPPTQNNYLYTETVTVKATPGGVWRVIANNPATGATTVGVLQDSPSVGFNPNDTDPIGDLMTEVSPGVYEYKFYHFEQSTGANNYEIVVTDGVDILDIHAKCNSVKEQFDQNLTEVCAYSDPLILQTIFETGTAQYYFIQNSAFEFTSNFDENILIQAASGNPITQLNPADYAPGSSVALYIKWLPTGTGQPGTSCPKTLVLNVNLGLDPTKCLAAIGDRTWVDENKSGVQDVGDTNLAGVTVTLVDETGAEVLTNGLGEPIIPIITGTDGHYEFTNLKPGTYKVKFSTVAGYERVSPNQLTVVSGVFGGSVLDEELDSDASTITGITENYVLIAGDYDISADAGFQKIAVALPINLINFVGKAFENSINLNWKTTNEKNFSHFEIEKSFDSKEFGAIAKINGSNSGLYNFQDNSNLSDINYYRLKMVDNDGSFQYSKIISVKYNENNSFVSVENPAQNGVINLVTNILNPNISIKSVTGADINFRSLKVGINQYQLKISNSNSGLYFVIIEDENGSRISKKILMY